MFEKIKKFYDMGLWTAEMVRTAVEKGVITEAECAEILGTETEADNADE